MNTIRVSNGLDLDQDRHCVGPDLGPNCLQRLSADDKGCCMVARKGLFLLLFLFLSSDSSQQPLDGLFRNMGI